MPIYTYVCKDCGEQFDLLVGVTSDKTAKKCSKCGSKKIEKIFSAFSVGKQTKACGFKPSTCPTSGKGCCPGCQ
ncbi:MAG: FmdB family zinc ribbon protein [Candidatus Omnitrophota bacterium]